MAGIFDFLLGSQGGDPNALQIPPESFAPRLPPGGDPLGRSIEGTLNQSQEGGHLTASPSPNENPALAGNALSGDLGETKALPSIAPQEGLFGRLRHQDANGMGFGDKLALTGMMLRDNADPGTVMEYQNAKLKQAQFQRQLALQARGNQAFRAAYQVDPKTGNMRFHPEIYAQVMGDALNPSDLVTYGKLNPEQSLQDGYIVQKDPVTGELKIVAQRPMTYGEQNSADTLTETKRHNGVEEGQGASRIAEDARSHRVNEGIAAGNLGVARQNADTSAQHLTLDRQTAARQPGPPLITNEQDALRLPKGSPFITPDGVLRTR